MSTPIIVGRDTEIQWLNQHIAQAVEGNPRMVFVVGEAGIGKSSLLQEVIRHTNERFPNILTATGYCNAQFGQADPLLPLREIAAQLFRSDDDSEHPAVAKRKASDVLVEFLSEVGPDVIGLFLGPVGVGLKAIQVIGKMSSARREAAQGQSPGERAAAGRTALFQDFCHLLFRVSNAAPLVLIIEDLHWSDESTAEFLFHLARSWKNQRICVIGTYRPDEIISAEPEHPVRRVERELLRYNLCHRLPLGWLTENQVKAWIAQRYPINRFPAAFVRWLHARTEGNAFFISETLNDLCERNLVRQISDGTWVLGESIQGPQSLPGSILAVLDQRLSRLEKSLYDLLSCASVEGEDFTAEVVASVQQVEIDQIIDSLLNTLARKYDIVSFKDERLLAHNHPLCLFEFRHSLMRTHLYERLQIPQRRRLHQKIGECIERLYADHLGDMTAVLARHYSLAKNAAKSYHYGWRAAVWAEQVYDYRAACQWLRTASASIPGLDLTAAEQADFWHYFGRLETSAGTFFQAEAYMQQALRYASQAGDLSKRADILDDLGYCYIESNRPRNAIGLLTEAITINEQANRIEHLAHSLVHIAFAYHKIGRQDLTKTHLEKAVNHLTSIQDSPGLALVYRHLGIHYRVTGDFQQSVRYLDEAARPDHQTGNKSHEASDYTNLGSTYLLLGGDEAKAMEYYQRALQLSRQIGKLFEEGHVHLNIARLYGLRGDTARGLSHAAEGLRLSQLVQETSNIIRGLVYMALLRAQRGNVAAAIRDIEEALAFNVQDHDHGWGLRYNLGSLRRVADDKMGSLQAYHDAADWLLNVVQELPAAERASYLHDNQRVNVLHALVEAARDLGQDSLVAWVLERLPDDMALEPPAALPRYYWSIAWR